MEYEDHFAEPGEENKENKEVMLMRQNQTLFDVKVQKVDIFEDLMQSVFWKTQKLEKMNLVGN